MFLSPLPLFFSPPNTVGSVGRWSEQMAAWYIGACWVKPQHKYTESRVFVVTQHLESYIWLAAVGWLPQLNHNYVLPQTWIMWEELFLKKLCWTHSGSPHRRDISVPFLYSPVSGVPELENHFCILVVFTFRGRSASEDIYSLNCALLLRSLGSV